MKSDAVIQTNGDRIGLTWGDGGLYVERISTHTFRLFHHLNEGMEFLRNMLGDRLSYALIGENGFKTERELAPFSELENDIREWIASLADAFKDDIRWWLRLLGETSLDDLQRIKDAARQIEHLCDLVEKSRAVKR